MTQDRTTQADLEWWLEPAQARLDVRPHYAGSAPNSYVVLG